MPVVTKRDEVLALYHEAAQKHWVLPCFCSENLTTTEAILSAAKEYGERIGQPDLPVIVATTVQYDHRTQACYYTHTRRWDVGLKLFLKDLEVLTGPGSPYEQLRVMIHLDHIQFDDDKELLGWDMGQFSSIMFDASKVPFEQNISLTAAFVKGHGKEILIEGACDEIVDATGAQRSDLTTAEKAKDDFARTGVDMIVANLGTEHRASAKTLHYHGENAREIQKEIGSRIVLHGASSVPADQIAALYEDGVCKVNRWTALERDSSPALLTAMIENASRVGGPKTVEELIQAGYLTGQCATEENSNLGYFTTVFRQDIIFHEMQRMIVGFFQLWYR